MFNAKTGRYDGISTAYRLKLVPVFVVDGMFNPKTGRYDGISTAYRMKLVSAFVVDPDKPMDIPVRDPKSVLFVEHVATGTALFRVICDRDMEGIVAKQASAHYTP
jgi:hypothetical protein